MDSEEKRNAGTLAVTIVLVFLIGLFVLGFLVLGFFRITSPETEFVPGNRNLERLSEASKAYLNGDNTYEHPLTLEVLLASGYLKEAELEASESLFIIPGVNGGMSPKMPFAIEVMPDNMRITDCRVLYVDGTIEALNLESDNETFTSLLKYFSNDLPAGEKAHLKSELERLDFDILGITYTNHEEEDSIAPGSESI